MRYVPRNQDKPRGLCEEEWQGRMYWIFWWDFSRWLFDTKEEAEQRWKHRYCFDECGYIDTLCPGGLK
jgi:hypothetical protein